MPIPQLQPKLPESAKPAAPPMLPSAPATPLLTSAHVDVPLAVRKRPGRGRFFRLVIFLALIFSPFLVSAGLTAWFVNQARADLNLAVAAAEELDFGNADYYLAAAEKDAENASRALIPCEYLRWLPWVGTQVETVDHVLAAGMETSEALRAALSLGRDIYALVGSAEQVGGPVIGGDGLVSPEKTLSTLSREEKRAILAKLSTSGQIIADISARMQAAERELAQIPEAGVAARLRQTIDPIKQRVAAATKVLKDYGPLIDVLPRMIGYPTPKKYLFFLANNAELRPSAGFFGSYGTIALADGEITSMESDDIYNLDFRAPEKLTREAPKPIQTYLGLKQWFLRDANWSPDFAAAATTALVIYDEEAAVGGLPPGDFDGVLVITPDVARDLLRLVGNVTVDGVEFTPENLVEKLEYQVEYDFLKQGKKISERKLILAHLVEEVVHRITRLPASRWPELLDLIERDLRNKQILLYEHDAELQRFFEEKNWAGRVSMPPGDFLLVVDANMAALKTDMVMQRSIEYTIEPAANGRFKAVATVTYKNTGKFGPLTTRYRTYTRFYVPVGSTLVAATGHLAGDKLRNPKLLPGTVDVTEELGKTVFGMFTAVEPGETRKLRVEYLLPENISESARNGSYSLLVQKQSGAGDYPLTLDLRFGKNLRTATPPESGQYFNDEKYWFSTPLSEDRFFSIEF